MPSKLSELKACVRHIAPLTFVVMIRASRDILNGISIDITVHNTTEGMVLLKFGKTTKCELGYRNGVMPLLMEMFE